MTIAVANVANTNTFLYWQTITNQLAGAMSTAVITTTANGTTAQTAGNAAIGGTMFANIHLANIVQANGSLFVGNSTVNAVVNSTTVAITNSTANIIITVPTSSQISNGQLFLNANGSWVVVQTTTYLSNSFTTTGTGSQIIDQWPIATFRSAEYLVNVWDNNANNHYSSKILVTHDSAASYTVEHSQITTNSSVGTFSSTVSGANAQLNFVPVSSNTTVRYARTLI